MAKDLYSTLDLNLLRTFVVLMQEKNMRKASQRLFVSQPAISQSLQKLRNHFSDELFVKVSTGLEPTPFAESMAKAITPHLHGLEQSLNHTYQFDPALIEHKLRIALSPIVMICLSGPLFRLIREQAPHAELELVSWSNSTIDDIAKGEILLGVGYETLISNKEVYQAKLLDLIGRIFVRNDHPLTKKIITPKELDGYEFASLISPGWNDNFSYTAQKLSDLGIEYKVGFRSELVMAIVDVIQHTDMYFPHSNLFPIEQFPSLRSIDLDVDGKPHVKPIYCHTHIKYRHTDITQWLFNLIQSVLKQQANKHSLL